MSHVNKLKDKVVVVTGGASGIGAATVAYLADAGALPIVMDRDRVDDPMSFRLDITSEFAVVAAFAQIAQMHGTIDGLVTCAGITADSFLTEMTVEQFDAVIAVNLKGTFLAMREAAKLMQASGRMGSIVAISSLSAAGNKGQANYASSKAAVNALVATAALELGRFGIRVNSILPGPVDTPMLTTVPEGVKAAWVKSTPLGEIATPEDIAKVVLFLLGDASSHITGQHLVVSGGMRF